MPEKGRTSVSLFTETFERFRRYYEAHVREMREQNIANPSQLIIKLALDRLRELEESDKGREA